MTQPAWRISIDTGGTFTDCIAQDPHGATHRLKVLSNASLRGRIQKWLDRRTLQISQSWPTEQDIFKGYNFRLLGEPTESPLIESVDLAQGLMILKEEYRGNRQVGEFEIHAHEEAPVLVARLLTQTPLGEAFPELELRLGSTKGTNALLERKGARVGAIFTHGLEDLLLIGDQSRPDLFAKQVIKPQPLYHAVLGIKERISSDGEVLTQIEEAEIRRMLEWALAGQFDAIAITLLNSYRNPEHERLLAQALASKVSAKVVCSHELISSVKLLPRAETTVVNAYLSPVIDRYVANIRHALGDIDFKIMTSAGGLVSAEQFHAKDSLLSGPAGGVVGAAAMAKACGYPRVLTLDMGGTSTDVAKYQEALAYEHETQVGPARLLAPTLAVHTVAAGGGSLCGFDGQKLWVGPESASAWPGPACYGAGGPLTLTDVNLLLGRLDPQTVSIPLDFDAAQQALRKVIKKSNLDEIEALHGWLEIANETMAGAIRQISIEKGYDPKDYALLAFGGAGGMHVAEVAESLGIPQILVPYDAGIMSAVGIHQAQIERFAHVQVLEPWQAIKNQLDDWINPLKESVQQKLRSEGLETSELEEPRVWLFLRFEGQDHSLEVSYRSDLDIEAEFEAHYRKLYGHWLENRALELEAIKVGGRQKVRELPMYGVPGSTLPNKPDTYSSVYPVYHWENQNAGQCWQGPVLLASPLGTTFIPKGWKGCLDEGFNLRMNQIEKAQVGEPSRERAAAIDLELFTRRFQSVAEEMGALLQRSSFSVNIKERLDFSCALLDAEGYLVANAPHIPVHLGSLGVCTRLVKDALPLGPGDVAITNHPGYGGSHLPDVTLIAPVYDEDGHLLGYLANRAHHAEIGGKRPGSMPPDASRLVEEGVVIAPQYLLKGGQARWQAMRELFTQGPFPSRSVEENLADLRAALASIKAGEATLRALSHQHGRKKVRTYMQELKAYAALRLREQLAKRAKGSFSAEEKLDDGSALAVSWSFEKDEVRVDFSGTADVHPFNFNANLAIVNSAVLYVLRLFLDEDLPLNEGLMMPVSMILPPGILNPPFEEDPALCPAVVGGNVETSQRLINVLLKPLNLLAASQGTMNNLLFGHAELGYYETIGGGTGAGPGFVGAHAVHHHMTNTRITDPEILELRYPVRLEAFCVRWGSGGDGKYLGGNGIRRKLRFLEPISLTLLTQHRKEAPYGLAGGGAGSRGEQYLWRVNGDREAIPGIGSWELLPGEAIEILTPGGGGYGSTA